MTLKSPHKKCECIFFYLKHHHSLYDFVHASLKIFLLKLLNKEVENNVFEGARRYCSSTKWQKAIKRTWIYFLLSLLQVSLSLADPAVSKRTGNSYRIEIHFAVFNRFYLLFSFMKLVET